jgi:hypothetical protein
VIVTAVAMGAASVLPAFAFGYRYTGTDPNDVEPGGAVDVRGTTLKVWESPKKGGHWFRLTIRAYERFPRSYNLRVLVDARGGPRHDEKISFVNGEGPPFCGLNYRGGGGWTAPLAQIEHRVTCVFAYRKLRANKRIRWRIRGVDRAPNRGYYP